MGYAENLPMPQEATIKWRDESLSESSERSAERRCLQQRVIPTPSDLVLFDLQNEDLEMTDYNSTTCVGSPSDVLQEAQFLLYNQPEIIEKTVGIAMAARKYISTRFCAAVLDPHLTELWDPVLNNLPFSSLNQDLKRICEFSLAMH